MIFYSSSLYLLGISMVISVIVIHMSKNKQSKPVPWFVKDQLDGHLGTFLGLNRLTFEVTYTRIMYVKQFYIELSLISHIKLSGQRNCVTQMQRRSTNTIPPTTMITSLPATVQLVKPDPSNSTGFYWPLQLTELHSSSISCCSLC